MSEEEAGWEAEMEGVMDSVEEKARVEALAQSSSLDRFRWHHSWGSSPLFQDQSTVGVLGMKPGTEVTEEALVGR
jgi:hypothetical protein